MAQVHKQCIVTFLQCQWNFPTNKNVACMLKNANVNSRTQFVKRCLKLFANARGRASQCAWWPGTISTRPGPSPPSVASSNQGITSLSWRGRTSIRGSGIRAPMRWDYFLCWVNIQTGEGRILRQAVRGFYSDRHAGEYKWEYSDMQAGQAEWGRQAGKTQRHSEGYWEWVKNIDKQRLKDIQTEAGRISWDRQV